MCADTNYAVVMRGYVDDLARTDAPHGVRNAPRLPGGAGRYVSRPQPVLDL